MSSATEDTTRRRKRLNFLRWLPVAASLTLLLMIAVVSSRTMSDLNQATSRHQHTVQEILAAHAYENNIVDIQNSMRDFVTLGDATALAACQGCIAREQQLFDRLAGLTHDNPEQQRRLQGLSVAMKDLFAYDARLIDAYKQHGPEAVLQIEQTGEGRAVARRAREILKAFTGAEQELLDARAAAEQLDYIHAERLLIIGSILAVIVLVWANFMTSREMARRRRVEIERKKLIAELQRTLAEVKTLSGLIPICAWCKNVRNDKGYWQTVEQYVHSHSDANFSHSICPGCQVKFKEEIARGGLPIEKPPAAG